MIPLSSLPFVSPYSAGGSSSSSSADSAPNSTPSPTPSAPASSSPSRSQSKSAAPAVGESHNAGQEVGGLDEAQLKELTELKARDREVRAHEAAHQAAGGQHAGAMSLTYQRGPDGAQYAVGGEVSIDMSAVNGNAQATIEKMRTVRAAAMAPAQPSGQDRAVAAQAMQVMLQAQSELVVEQKSEGPQPKISASDSKEASPSSQEISRESASEQPSRAGQQARNTYQDIAGFGPEPAFEADGFLSISV